MEEKTCLEERVEENLGAKQENRLGSIKEADLGRRLEENLQDRKANLLCR